MSMTKFCMEACISMCKYSCKKSCCAFSAYQSFNFLVLVLWKCASSIAAVPVAKQSLFPHLTFRRNSWIVSGFWKGRLSFFSNSASSSRPSWKQRGEKTLFQIHCVQEGGRRGEGDADGQVLWLSDWFTRTSPVIPLFHYATTAEQYHSTTLFDLPEPSHTASYMIPVLFPTTIPQSVPHSTAPYQIYKPTNQKRQKQGSKTLANLPEPAQRQTWYHISTSLPQHSSVPYSKAPFQMYKATI